MFNGGNQENDNGNFDQNGQPTDTHFNYPQMENLSIDDPITEIIVESDDDLVDDVSLLNMNAKLESDDGILGVDISSCSFTSHKGGAFSIDAVQLKDNQIVIATGGEDDQAKLWDYYKNRLIADHTMYDSVITSHFNTENNVLLLADMSGRIRLFETSDIENTFSNRLTELETENIEWCIWHPHIPTVVIAGRVDWIIQYWHYTTGRYRVLQPPMKIPSRLCDDYNGEAPYVTFSKSEPYKLAVGYGDGSIAIWSLNQNTVIHRFLGESCTFTSMVSCIQTFSNDRMFVAGSRYSTAIKLYNFPNNKFISELDDVRRLGHSESNNMVHNIAVTEDNQYIAVGIIISKDIEEEEEIERRKEIILNTFEADGSLKNNGYNYAAEKTIERTNQRVYLGNEHAEEEDDEEIIVTEIQEDEVETDPQTVLDQCNKKFGEIHQFSCNGIPTAAGMQLNGANGYSSGAGSSVPGYEDLEKSNLFAKHVPFILADDSKPPKNGSQIAIWNYKTSRLMHVLNFGSPITELVNFKDNLIIAGFANGYVIAVNPAQGKILFKVNCSDTESVHTLKYISKIDAIAVTTMCGQSVLIDSQQVLIESSQLQNQLFPPIQLHK